MVWAMPHRSSFRWHRLSPECFMNVKLTVMQFNETFSGQGQTTETTVFSDKGKGRVWYPRGVHLSTMDRGELPHMWWLPLVRLKCPKALKPDQNFVLHCATDTYLLLTVGSGWFFLYTARTIGTHSIILLGEDEGHKKLKAKISMKLCPWNSDSLDTHQMRICPFVDISVRRWSKLIISLGHISCSNNNNNIQISKKKKKSVEEKKKVSRCFISTSFKWNVWLFNSIWCFTFKVKSIKAILIRKLCMVSMHG